MAKTASSRPRAPATQARDRYLVFAFGIIFLSVILYLLTIDPTPSTQTFFAFRLTLALAAGGIGAMIPGLVSYRQRLPHDGLVRLGGGLALAAGVWFTNPPGELAVAPPPPPPQDALPLMQRYLAGNLDDTSLYDGFSSAFKASISRDAYVQLHANIRKPLGRRIAGPVLMHSNFLTDIAGRKGPFVQAGYQSRFEGSAGVWVEWSQTVAEDGAWRIDGYQLVPCVAPACMPLAALDAAR